MTDTTRITVDVLDGPNVRYKDQAYYQSSKAILYSFDLSWAAKGLWQILDDHAKQDRKANPSRKRLAQLMNASPDTVDNYIAELQDQGWLIVTPVFDSSGQHSNAYTLTIPKGLNVLADDYAHSTKEVEVKPKPKIAKKTRVAFEYKETDIAPRYALSYNHTREDVPAPAPKGVERALELSQSARRNTQALQSKTPQRPALPAAQTDKQREQAEALAKAREVGTWEAFQGVFRSQAMAERAYKEYLKEKEQEDQG
ncbi:MULTISPECIES: helix-turn-helix domain-containing protein [unclassified Streptomyces]|uniref:helix-turn-helix domain-containing protein n=1 Tax=unclassified Streptomyces TaxID=2593676 RepID=UPI0033B5028D